jgi:hypothetical protein
MGFVFERFNPRLFCSGQTPLHWSSERGLMDVCQFLVASNADLASKGRCRRVSSAALSCSATHPLRCSNGFTPLQLAIRNRKSDVAAFLQTAAATSAQARIASCAVVALRPLSPLLTLLLRFTIILQVSAAARIVGKDDIFESAKDGNLELVQDHVAADPESVHERDETYV